MTNIVDYVFNLMPEKLRQSTRIEWSGDLKTELGDRAPQETKNLKGNCRAACYWDFKRGGPTIKVDPLEVGCQRILEQTIVHELGHIIAGHITPDDPRKAIRYVVGEEQANTAVRQSVLRTGRANTWEKCLDCFESGGDVCGRCTEPHFFQAVDYKKPPYWTLSSKVEMISKALEHQSNLKKRRRFDLAGVAEAVCKIAPEQPAAAHALLAGLEKKIAALPKAKMIVKKVQPALETTSGIKQSPQRLQRILGVDRDSLRQLYEETRGNP
ncbi:hypothetical protein ACFLU6_05490 [Acidobacteriota bacterium]